MKICNICKEEKPLTMFYKDKSRMDGLSYRCKNCSDLMSNDYKKRNPETIKSAISKWNKDHPHKNREAVKKYREKNIDIIKERKKKYRLEHPDKNRALTRRYRQTPKGKLRHSISNGILRTLPTNKNGKSCLTILGYSIEELKKHLEKQFKDGMTWKNYGKWHIDHIIPISAFNYETPDDIDFKKCWSLSNLQPLWARDNVKKKDKLQSPFQPSLLLKRLA